MCLFREATLFNKIISLKITKFFRNIEHSLDSNSVNYLYVSCLYNLALCKNMKIQSDLEI